MADTDDQALEIRDSLLSKSPGPKFYDPHRKGEIAILEIVDCRGHVLATTPPLEPKALVREGVDIRVRADRGCKPRAFIRFWWYRGSRLPVTARRRSGIGPLIRNGWAYFTLKPNSPLLSRSLNSLRTWVRTFYVRSKRSWSKSSARPNPEEYFSTAVSYKSDRIPPFRGWISWYSYRRNWTGTVTPGFGKTHKGRLPVNPHSVSLRESWSPPLMVKLWAVGTPYESFDVNYFASWGYGTDYWTEPPAHLGAPYNKALSRLIEKAELDAEANLAQDLVQFNQTLRTLTSAFTKIRGAVRALKRGNLPRAQRFIFGGKKPRYRRGGGLRSARSVAENWLELQYGWKPLLNDCDGAARSLAYYINNNADNLVRSISASATSRSETRSPLLDDRVHTVEIGELYQYTETHTRIGIRYRVGNATTLFLSQTGFTNPLNLAWEVLPYSFVVDWALPIGPYLEALHAWDGLVFLDGFEVNFTRRVRSGYMDWGPGRLVWYDGYDSQYAGSVMGEGIQFDRTKLSSFPSPRIPSFKNPLSTLHAANALALMVSEFTGGTIWNR